MSYFRPRYSNPVIRLENSREFAGQEEATAGIDLGGHRAVAVSPTGLIYADPTDPSMLGTAVGISLHAAVAGDPIVYQHWGTMHSAAWNWIPGEDIFFDSLGILTQSVPAGVYRQRIAYAIDETSIYIDVAEPIQLIS